MDHSRFRKAYSLCRVRSGHGVSTACAPLQKAMPLIASLRRANRSLMLPFRSQSAKRKIVTLPLAFPALHASHGGIWLRDPDGQTRAVSNGAGVGRPAGTPGIFLNAPLMGTRLGSPAPQG